MMSSAPDKAGSSAWPARPQRHWRALAILTALVVLLHVWLTYELAQEMQSLAPAAPGIQRMEATYVTEVKLSAPPVVAAATAQAVQEAAPAVAPKKRRKARPPAKAASAPPEAASAPPVVADAASSAVVAEAKIEPPPEPASAPSEPAASAPSPVVDAASSPKRAGPTFIWPKATKVNYKLEGNYRGPFYGVASVEWIRQGSRYQVHMEASVPMLGGTRMTSEGDIVPQGLSPKRYESVNRMLFKSSKAATLTFEENEVVLANGQREPRLPDMQDPVSQLIQLAYRFMMKPELLQPGNTIEMPIAWTKKTEALAYDVVAEEMLHTAIGEIPTLHVKPRRMIKDKDNLSGEIWFAPGLQYLPVRIFTKWSEEIYLDMQMDGAPQQTPGDETPPDASNAASK